MDKALYWQAECNLQPFPRGFHLIMPVLEKILLTMPALRIGLVHFFLQHTSASLAISENASAEIAWDLESYFTQTVPEQSKRYHHTIEGEDDMPAHIKNTILGVSLTIPLQNNRLALGLWQGIYLCEHRNQAPARKILITAHGMSE